MSALDYHRTVFGYHGCDRSVADHVLGGGAFRVSENDYDWLGRGIYFWEYGPARALDWAKKKPAPASVGAVIHLGRCFDLLDVRYTSYLRHAFAEYAAAQAANGKSIPINPTARNAAGDILRRPLDCAVLDWSIAQLERALGEPFQTVRGAFIEGAPVFPGSCILSESHIQIAVRDTGCIVGVFQPRA